MACRKHRKNVYLILPLKSTTVFTPPEKPLSERAQEIYSAILTAVQTKLENSDDLEKVDQLLDGVGVGIP